jgi:hypothetical protein
MRILHHPHTPAAVLLAGIAALHAVLGGGAGMPFWASHGAPSQEPQQSPLLPAPGTTARKNLDWCRHNVAIVHDVYWASACSVLADEQQRRHAACSEARATGAGLPPDLACHVALGVPDDSAECMRPNEHARVLNTARAQAEQQCFDEAAAPRAGLAGAR